MADDLSRKSRWRRGWWIALAVLLLIGVGAYGLRDRWLPAMGSYLIAPSDDLHAEVGYVLVGGRSTRADLAAKLYHQGQIQRILLSTAGAVADVDGVALLSEQEILWRMLVALGVPESALERIDTPAQSTHQEAENLARYLRDHRTDRVTIITSDYHTRRCRLLFGREIKDAGTRLRYAGAPSHRLQPRDWWKSPEGLSAGVVEWSKLVANALTAW